MLSQSPLWAIVAARDFARAKKFYAETVGLALADESVPASDAVPGTALFRCADGTGLVVYEKPDMMPSDNTVAGWNVSDLEAEMRELRAQGVTFEDYDTPDLKTENGIATFGTASDAGTVKSAWFKDPDGNILAINQM